MMVQYGVISDRRADGLLDWLSQGAARADFDEISEWGNLFWMIRHGPKLLDGLMEEDWRDKVLHPVFSGRHHLRVQKPSSDRAGKGYGAHGHTILLCRRTQTIGKMSHVFVRNLLHGWRMVSHTGVDHPCRYAFLVQKYSQTLHVFAIPGQCDIRWTVDTSDMDGVSVQQARTPQAVRNT